ncbi:ABC transporter ATP-binding protein [bacterium]|nr:ABC transporter ATP-binding protein [bacterium]
MAAPETLRVVLRDGFRLIARFVRAHPVSFALAVSGATLFVSAIVASALVVGHVTDTLIIPVLDGGEALEARWVGALAAITGVAAWKAAGITLRRTAAGWLQYRTQADVRSHLIEHQLGLELSWFGTRSTGDLLAVAETDAHSGTFILAPLPFGTGAALLLVASIGIITWVDPMLGLVAFVALSLVVAIDLRGAWRIFEVFGTVQESRGAVSGVAHESFDGALTVKALGRENFETGRMTEASERLRDDIIRVVRVWSLFRAIVEAFPAVTMIVALIVGSIRIGSGDMTPGELVSVIYLLSLLAMPVRLIGYVLWDLAHSLAAWRRVEGVLEVDDMVEFGDAQARPDPSGADVEGEGVSFAYGEDTVLEHLELEIPSGRTVAIVGPTASGKSTLAMLLARLWDPTSGTITLDGRDLRDFARSALPREVAFVSQEAFLFDDDVEGNITLGMQITHEEVRDAARLASAEDFILQLPDGYGTRLGERGVSLSGGQRQRIALARALARRPRLLILDDATSAVDPSIESAILKGLRRAELPSTVVVVAHRQSSIVLADEIVYIEDGRVAAHGSHADLLVSEPGYSRLLQAYERDADDRRTREEAAT